MSYSFSAEEYAIPQQTHDFTPLYAVLAALVWVIHDYFITLEDEVTYFWSQKPGGGALIFFWIRYYTIFLVVFDTIEIHMFPTPEIMLQSLILGAVSLWSIEIIMQLRVYFLFNQSKRVAIVNGVLFIISIAIYLWILIDNTLHQKAELRDTASSESRNGCPTFKGGGRWAQWLPATLFEFVLFALALYKTKVSSSAKTALNGRKSLTAILLHENIVFFFVVGCILVFNNLMVVCETQIPWFGFGPFHAALGISTCRMLIHLRKFASGNLEVGPDNYSLPNLEVDSSELAPLHSDIPDEVRPVP